MEGKDVIILWDTPIHTDKEITANKPDIVIKDKKENKCIFIDMSVPSERNNRKTVKVQRPGNRSKQNVEHENDYCPCYRWSPGPYQKANE